MPNFTIKHIQGVPLTWEMLNSKAYKELPYAAGKALPYFLGKVKNSFNDPQRYWMEFSFSYKEANKLGFATTMSLGEINEKSCIRYFLL